MRVIVFDLETRNTFQEAGSSDPVDLDLSLAGVYDSETNEYSSYLVEDLSKLWPIIERADILVGYNSDHFDIPLLNKYYPGDLTKIKSLDIMREIKNSLGRRIGLDTIAEATLGKKKIGHGLQAIAWWRQGDIESIRKYCLEDVKITKEVYEYALAHKHVKLKDLGTTREIPLDTSNWHTLESAAMTFSLPF